MFSEIYILLNCVLCYRMSNFMFPNMVYFLPAPSVSFMFLGE